jgi:transcriptional regulator with XRE-family HTH domain
MPRTSSSAVASHAVGRAIREARREAGLTQKDVAERLGSSAPYLSSVENGRENLTVGQIWAIADAMDAEVHLALQPSPPADLPSIPAPPPPGRGAPA